MPFRSSSANVSASIPPRRESHLQRRWPTPRSWRGENGQAAVEFALVVPLFLMLVVALVKFGGAVHYWLDMTHAANVGARIAAVDLDVTKAPYSASSMDEYILTRMGPTALQEDAEVGVCIDGENATGKPVKVTVTYDFPLRIPLLLERTVPISTSATMRLEHRATNYAWSAC
jgi:Flp pilus assembly protein TadG